MDKNQMWDALLAIGLTEETLQVVSNLNGFTEDTMTDILYVHTGLRSFDQIED